MNELSKTLSLIKKYCAREATPPILQNVLMGLKDGMMTLATTNLEAWVSTSFPCTGNPFSATVSLEKLEKATKNMTDPLDFTVTVSKLIVSDGKTRVALITIPVEEFPPKPEAEELLGELDLDGIERVCSFAHTETDRSSVLTYVLLEVEGGKTKLVACDGFKLAFLERTSNLPDMKLLMPARALSNIPKGYTKAELFSGKECATLDFGGFVLTVRTLEHTYPNYNQVIPVSYNSKLIVNVKEWLDVIKSIKVFSDETSGIVRHSVTDNAMIVSAQDEDGNVIERAINVEVDQLSPVFVINDKQLTTTLKACSGNDITVKLTMSEDPTTLSETIPNIPTRKALVFEDGTDWKAVVMPMHLIKDW